jgi:hypothetical protein
MGFMQEKNIRAYQLKNKTLVCPVCATDEERDKAVEGEFITEDKIHDHDPVYCVRCKKKIEK